jgi:secreted trypsin-like serine protease
MRPKFKSNWLVPYPAKGVLIFKAALAHKKLYMIMRKKAIVVLSFALGLFHAGYGQQAWIVGGETAAQGQFPWLGDIRVSGQHMCGSSLIHPQWVVTAAHCLEASAGTDTSSTVRFNTVDQYGALNPNGGVEKKVKKIFIHPGYDGDIYSTGRDIGLIMLQEPVTSITPIPMPAFGDTATAYLGGSPVKVAGWGLRDTIPSGAPNRMKWCSTRIIGYTLCDSVTQAQTSGNHLSSKIVCAGYTGDEAQSGAAAGDSGGPLWAENGSNKKLLGIVSGGFSSTTLHNLPGVYTKVAAFRPWIDSVIAANSTGLSVNNLAWNDEDIKIGTAADNIRLIFGDMQSGKLNVRIYSLEGKMVYNTDIQSPSFRQYTISTNGMSKGIYLLRIFDSTGRSYSRKLVNTQ